MANNRADDRTSIDRDSQRQRNGERSSARLARAGPNGPTRIRTSALTNGPWRLNQSGEIWLSRASATRHVAWPRYLCASTRSRSWSSPRSRASGRGGAPALRFIGSRYIPLASCRLFGLPTPAENRFVNSSTFPRRDQSWFLHNDRYVRTAIKRRRDYSLSS